MVRGQAVSTQEVQLSDSTLKDRPHFKTFLQSDANAGFDDTEINREQWRQRQIKLPKVRGRFDVDSFQLAGHVGEEMYRRWNDEGEYRFHITANHRSPAPHRAGCDGVLDPTNGFVSVAGEVVAETGNLRIPSMAQLPDKPQAAAPQVVHSIRAGLPGPPPRETRRATEYEEPKMRWAERVDSLAALRARLGGWTSDVDPRSKIVMRLKGSSSDHDPDAALASIAQHPSEAEPLSGSNLPCDSPPVDAATLSIDPTRLAIEMRGLPPEMRRALAVKYAYTSVTQQLFNSIPWDAILPPKKWAATTTMEAKPDLVTERSEWSRYYPAAAAWQSLGGSWDRFQLRDSHLPSRRPVVFGNSTRRSGQIPGYTGFVAADADAVDDFDAPFQGTQTLVRTTQPKPTRVSWRPTIPNFAGKTHWLNVTPLHSRGPALQTMLSDYRHLPLPPPHSDFRQTGILSRLVTTVPPFNPFHKMQRFVGRAKVAP